MEKDVLESHLRVARANRDLYDTSSEEIADFEVFAKIPFVEEYVERNVQHAVDLISGARSGDAIRALDIGTGSGHLLRYLIHHTAPENIHAIDISGENLKLARARYPGVHCHLGDFVCDFESDERFDLMTLYSVLHHFFDWRSFFAKADRLLSPGGVIYIDHEPLGGLVTTTINSVKRIEKRNREHFFLAEYHQFEDTNDPFEIADFLEKSDYRVEIYFSNFSLAGGFRKLISLNPVPSFLTERRITSRTQGWLRHFFLSYKLMLRKGPHSFVATIDSSGAQPREKPR